jgi:NADH:ubiquinone oxidoreductase subunit 3 (subunit A)
MGDIVLIYLLQNILLFGIIFWALTWVAEYFYSKKNHLTKRQFYECGFKSNIDLDIQVNINFPMLCVFLILYDIEFTLLLPFLFNVSNACISEFFFLISFVLLIIFSLIYDWQFNALNWQL